MSVEILGLVFFDFHFPQLALRNSTVQSSPASLSCLLQLRETNKYLFHRKFKNKTKEIENQSEKSREIVVNGEKVIRKSKSQHGSRV